MTDSFKTFTKSITSPIDDGFAVTPNDSVDLPNVTRGIMVATAGNVSVVLNSDTSLVLPALQPGAVYPIRAKRINQTGTVATGIVGLF